MSDLIDWAKAQELCAEVGAEDFDEVVELFLEEVQEKIDGLGTPGRCLEHDLHFLKGAALNLGFKRFSQLCLEGETAAAAGRDAEVNTAKIVHAYVMSRALFLGEWQARLAG